MVTKQGRNELIDEIKAPLSEGLHGLSGLKKLGRDMLQMGMLLILDVLLDMFITIMLNVRPIITHP